jgi:fatty acid synthase subunit alpha
VELGPSKTLINMGQKTIKRKIASAERPVDSRVQFLASTQDTKELCYEYDMPASLEEEALEDKQPSLEASPPLLERIRNTQPPSAASVPTVTIEDVPLSGEEIVRALVARKLKKPIAQISTSKSVKELCGGMFILSSGSLKACVGL